jgi:GGDEF domain-containing protein
LAAGAATVAGLAICHTTPLGEGLVFFLLPAVCGALAWFTRGAGATVGGGFGIVVGLSLSIALTQHSQSPLPNQLAFAALAASIGGLIGCLSGDQRDQSSERESASRFEPVVQRRPHIPEFPSSRARGARMDAFVTDFEAWLDESTADAATSADLWGRFGQFVRSSLRVQAGARRVRLFRVLPNQTPPGNAAPTKPGHGIQLEPLVQRRRRSRDAGDHPPIDTSGDNPLAPIPAALVRRLCIEGLPLAGGPASSRGGRESWLLPIREGGRVIALVEAIVQGAAGDWRPADSESATAASTLLSLCWRQVLALDALAHGRRLDGATGVLNRGELLSEADRIVADSVRDAEPVMMMGVAVEGLRALDDAGHYGPRDALIRRLGEVLCLQVRSDDIVGRFADDRFIILLRRLDARLGTLIGEKLVRTLRQEIATLLQHESGEERPAIAIRAALATADAEDCDGASLLAQTLNRLDGARESGVELAAPAAAGQRPATAVAAAQRPSVAVTGVGP